ncbi:hypothetical protein [Saccharibacillus kuerlensis]|uniref:Uncharacterized protein n=1 Tax=Saccharibacillus kuerlensis TaxID=459527 RepID=A0ABQ2L7H6_9BACL|nr:hypothetical protein [Saccharibacillus kuerlensis]GGO05902.1 hypothetical protein GCM10010969_32710 [Saccharibacillus kuerlensis]
MNNNMLEEELNSIQLEYNKVLKNAVNNIYVKDSEAVIDEILVFWERNKKILQNILHFLFPPYSAYVFTSATILDIDDGEHFPFVSLGKYHLWDDPIYKYVTMVRSNNINLDFEKKMKNQIIATLKDNMKIIKQAFGIIYILPFRLLNETNQFVYEAADQAFFSMFKENINKETYKNLSTIEEVKNVLSDGIAESIIFSEKEESDLSLINRFEAYRASAILPISKDATDAEVFYLTIFGYLAQAFDTLLLSVEYKLIPYIRFEVAFKYIFKISSNFGENEEVSSMLLKCAIAHVFYRNFDESKVHDVAFKSYYEAIKKYDLENKIFEELKKENLNFTNMKLKKLVEIIDNNFEKFVAGFFDEEKSTTDTFVVD